MSLFRIATTALLVVSFSSAISSRVVSAERESDIVPESAKLETLWDDGGFTEGAVGDWDFGRGRVAFPDSRRGACGRS